MFRGLAHGVWQRVDRRMRAALGDDTAGPILGDFADEFDDRIARRGGLLAAFWLWRETTAVLRAYREDAGRAGDRRDRFWRTIRDELPLAGRRLRTNAAAGAASAFTLALAIGAGAAAWTTISALLFHPLRVADPASLAVVEAGYGAGPSATWSDSVEFHAFRAIQDSATFADAAGFGEWTLVVGAEGAVVRRAILFTSANYFRVLGISPAGRGFLETDASRGAPLVAVASARYARTLAPVGGALNRTIFISGQPVKIVGIAPDGFRGTTLTSAPELYMPMRTLATVGRSVINYFGDSTHPSSATSWISVIGRLRPGESVGKATAALGALGPHLATPMPLRAQAASAAALPTKTRDRIAAFARMLGATLGLLIVVAGLALGLLLVIRVEARRAELAMCLALGATKARLAVGVVLEGLGLVAAGVLGSLPICWWLLGSVGAFRLPGDIDIGALSLSVDIEALTAAAALGVFIAGLIAVVAGVLGARAAEARAVQMSPGAMSGHGRRPVRAVLVVAQVAVSSALLLGTALFARSLISALDLNASLAPSRVLSAGLPLGALSYDVPRAERFVANAVEVLARAPEVAGVAVKAELGGMSGTGRLTINGERRPLDGRYVEYVAVDERYFDTLGLSITSGRNFLASDVDGSPLVAIVSESMGRWLAADADPIGVGITETRGRRGQPFAVARVVGVVPDVVKSVGVLEPFTIYFAMSQRGPFTPDRTLVVRAAGDVRTARSSVAAALRSADRSMPQGAILSMRDQVETQMAPQAFAVRVLGALALVAMSLSVLSTFVLASSIARLRMRETAVRAALGAKRIPLGSRLMWQTLRMVVLGLLCGAALAWLGRGLVASFLFQVSPFDPLAVAATGVFVLIVAMAVSLRPALAAANVDLVRLLKDN